MAKGQKYQILLLCMGLLLVLVLLQNAYWTRRLNTTDIDLDYVSNNNETALFVASPKNDKAEKDKIDTLCGRTKIISDVMPPWPYFQNRFKRMSNEVRLIL